MAREKVLEENFEIGQRIRAVRQEKGLTLADLSAKSGVAPATLSRIENGLMTGTVKSHLKICEALGVTLTDLYRSLQPEKRKLDIEAHAAKQDVFVHDEKSFSILLTSQVLSKRMMPVLIRLSPEGKTPAEEASDGAEKFLYCLSGSVKVTVGGKTYMLGPGDRLYFNASLPHFIENCGKSEAKCLAVSSPPAL